MEIRQRIWNLLADAWSVSLPNSMITDISQEQIESYIDRMLKGATIGRVVVNLRSE